MAMSDPPNSGPSVRRSRILLVDDDPMILRAMRRLLLAARPGWEIDMAASAAAASVLLEARNYDVVVTDLQMPVVGGALLLERLKAEQPSIVRVIHSSHVEAFNSEEQDPLAHAVVSKLGRPDELVLILDWALDQRRRRLRDSVGF